MDNWDRHLRDRNLGGCSLQKDEEEGKKEEEEDVSGLRDKKQAWPNIVRWGM